MNQEDYDYKNSRVMSYNCGCKYAIVIQDFENDLPKIGTGNKFVVSFDVELIAMCNEHLRDASA